MSVIASTEAGASGRYINLGSPASQDNIGAQTIIVYCKPADQSGNIGYYFAKGDSTGAGIRLIQNTSNYVAAGLTSTGTALAPSKIFDTAAVTLNTWQHWQLTYAGGLNYTDLELYIDAAAASGAATTANGTTAIGSDASYDVFLLNRTGLGRHVLGDVAYVARWSRVLNSTERANVRANGPLAEPTGLILCWANDQDYSTNAIIATARSTRVTGSTPPNTALGGDTTIGATVGNAVAAGATATVSSAVVISATVGNAVAVGITAAINAAGATISATVGNAVATGVTATIQTMWLDASYERSSVDLAASSITGNGSSALVKIAPKGQEWESAAFSVAWLEPSVEVVGVAGTNPTFQFLDYFTGMGGIHTGISAWQSTRRPHFSEDGGLTWTPYDTAVTLDTGNQWIEFRHSVPFTSNRVRISRSRQISVRQTGDWLAAFAAANPTIVVPAPSAVAYTPSGAVSGFAAQTFIADEFSTQVDSLGATVPVTPLYAFVIDDTSLMPLDGSAKRDALVSCGVHAGEDHAHWIFRGFLNHLVGSSTEALAIRRRYRILGYPNLNPPGRAGGGWRGSWTQGTGGADDSNRHFDNALGLEIVSKPKAAITTDIGSAVCHWAIDFHGQYARDWELISPYASSTLTRFHSLQQTNSGKTITNTVTYQAGYLVTWLQDTLGFKWATVAEHGDTTPKTDSELENYGAAFVATLATMSAEGAFGVICEPGNAVAAGVTAAVTTTAMTVINATPSNAVAAGATASIVVDGGTTVACSPGNAGADGAMAAVIKKISADPGGAVANGAIAALLRVIASEPGNAVAAGVAATVSGGTAVSCSPGGAVANGVLALVTVTPFVPNVSGSLCGSRPYRRQTSTRAMRL